MTFGEASQFCASFDMSLPNPLSPLENNNYANVGPSWMNVNVNDLLGLFYCICIFSYLNDNDALCVIFQDAMRCSVTGEVDNVVIYLPMALGK